MLVFLNLGRCTKSLSIFWQGKGVGPPPPICPETSILFLIYADVFIPQQILSIGTLFGYKEGNHFTKVDLTGNLGLT